MIVDSLMNKGQLTNKEIFQASCFLESSSFFKMIVPLIILFDGSSGLLAKTRIISQRQLIILMQEKILYLIISTTARKYSILVTKTLRNIC